MKRQPGPNSIIGILCGAAVSAVLLQTIVLPLIPDLPRMLNTSVVGSSWVLTSTLLTGAIAHPISGRLADIVGKRQMLLFCLAVMTVGAVVSALSTTLVPMVIGRSLQGLGMGIIPIGMALMRDVLPPHRLQSGVGIISATMGFGGALALPAAAWALQYIDWKWLFWYAAAQSLIFLGLVTWLLPADRQPRRTGTIDLPGAIGFAVATAALLIVITQGNAWGWTSTPVLGLLIGGLVLLGIWMVYQWRIADPMVDVRLAFTPAVWWANSLGVAMGYSMFVVTIAYPLIITAPTEVGYGLGHSVAWIGYLVMPGGIAMMLAGPLSGHVSRRVGARATIQIGIAFVVIGYMLILLLPGAPKIVLSNIVANIGFGLVYAALPVIIMSGVPHHKTGAANGLNALMRSVGMTVSGAATAVILSLDRVTIGGMDHATSPVMTIVLITAVAAAVLCFFFTFGIPRRSTV